MIQKPHKQAKTEAVDRRTRNRAGFSLLELMIAIVILGIGLIMVATMFPIAWRRASDLTEFTSQRAMYNLAHTTCEWLLQVDNSRQVSASEESRGSFAGDLIIDENVVPPFVTGPTEMQPRVHSLHIENAKLGPMPGYYPERNDATSAASPPFRLAQIPADLPFGTAAAFFYEVAYGRPQIRLEDRVYPPLRPRLNVDAQGAFTGLDEEWDNELDERRFAYAVFHKLAEATLLEDIDSERNFTMYYAALKRPRSTARYAQQDASITPDPLQRALPVTPQALPEDDDLLFPVPWRVQVYIPPSNIISKTSITGVPTVVEVNNPTLPTDPFVVDFFQQGTFFIDEVNGQVYEVTNRRLFTPTGGKEQAILTLDREVFIEDVDDGASFPGNVFLDGDEQLRAVWVFPPPVVPDRGAGNPPEFSGKPPAKGIDVQTLRVSPRR